MRAGAYPDEDPLSLPTPEDIAPIFVYLASDESAFTTGTYNWLLGGSGVAPFFVKQSLLETVQLDRMGSLHIAEELPDFHFELYTDARKYGYATLGFGAVYQLRAALDFLRWQTSTCCPLFKRRI